MLLFVVDFFLLFLIERYFYPIDFVSIDSYIC